MSTRNFSKTRPFPITFRPNLDWSITFRKVQLVKISALI
jgi:hypothetical protein